MTASNDEVANKTPPMAEPGLQRSQTGTTAISSENKAHSEQTLLTNKFITHQPGSGLNPLVDSAAYLFSIIGKLKQLKAYRHLNKLQKELIQEIDTFQTTMRLHGYSTEYILVSRYALCATLDDVISNTPWGSQGQWDNHSIQAVFNQDNTMTHDRFFVILERIIKDPTQYIELMELMYLCLSLGFKGNYRTTEYGSSQLEQITNALYKRIRSYRGDFNKVLAPFPIKINQPSAKPNEARSISLIATATFIAIIVIFIGLGYMLDTISNQAYQELIQIGNSILYETIHS